MLSEEDIKLWQMILLRKRNVCQMDCDQRVEKGICAGYCGELVTIHFILEGVMPPNLEGCE
jgi:hypothetical protein